ncbi:unnamed protein product [Brugia timori]|uniref:Lipoprotein n=1 Tax=Brugia timori TaxID=42155 RepID=A0A0R3R209_9BILA|nr:unnamed protein product [Brugia timori]
MKDLDGRGKKDLSGNLLTVLTDAQLQGPKSVRNLQFDRNFLTW